MVFDLATALWRIKTAYVSEIWSWINTVFGLGMAKHRASSNSSDSRHMASQLQMLIKMSAGDLPINREEATQMKKKTTNAHPPARPPAPLNPQALNPPLVLSPVMMAFLSAPCSCT
jgi:hypothetical protein